MDAIKNWEFPLWNPYYYSGIPLLATLQPAVFYPFNILLLILPFDLAFNWIIILHFFLAGVFMLLFMRELGTSTTGSFIGSLIFMLGGYMISVHNLLSTLLSVTWVPLTILLYLRAIKRSSISYAIFTGIVLAIMFTGGGIEVVYGTLGLLLFLALLPEAFLSLYSENPPHPDPLPQGEREPKVISPPLTGGDEGEGGRFSESEDSSRNCAYLTKRIAYLLLAIIIFLSLSAVQLIPFLELSHYSIRADGLSYFEATTWSMDLKDLVQFFIPDPYGYGTSEAKYWSNQSWLKTIYIGTIPFILSAFFFVENGRKTLAFLLLLFFSFVLAFGKNTVIYEYLYYYLPSFNKIRYPVKFLFLIFILLAISAGIGWDSLKQNFEKNRKSGKRIIFCLLFLATIAAVIFGGLSYFDKEVKDFLIANGIKYPDYNDVNINVFNTKRFLVIFIIAVLIFYSGLRSLKARKALPYLLVSILTIDLFFAHFGYYFTTTAEEYHKSSESMGFILKDKEWPFRIFVTPKTKKGIVETTSAKDKDKTFLVPKLQLGNALSANDSKNVNVGIANFDKEIIQGYNLERRIFDMEGIEVMRLSDYEKVFAFLTTAPGPDATNLFALLNVQYVLSIPKIKSKEFKLVKVIQAGSDKNRKKYGMDKFLKIYQNLNYLPRAFLVEKYKVLAKEEEYKKIMQGKEFRPGEEALLYEEPWASSLISSSHPHPIPTPSRGRESTDFPSPGGRGSRGGGKGSVVIKDYHNNSITLSVNTDRPRILVLSETYYPGWKVYVDGQEKKILKANFAFRAVPLSAGQHEVRFIYAPWTFKIGLYITLLTIISLLSFGILKIFIYRR